VDTIVGRSGDFTSAASAIRQVLGMSKDHRVEMARRSADRVLRDYTWAGQALRTLVEMYPELAERAGEVAATLDREDRDAVLAHDSYRNGDL
jgi:hypothetical protein